MKKQLRFLFLILVVSIQTNAQSGAALAFSGSGDYVQLTDPNFGTANFTIETWMKPNTSAGAYLITNRSVEMGGAGNWFVIHYNNNGGIGLELADAGMGSAYFATANNVITVGAWNHVAVVRSGLNIYIYVNGVLQGSRLEPGMRNLNTGQNSLRLSGWANVGVAFFNGMMDETRLWNVARTECELNIYKDCEIPTTATGLVGNYHFNQGIDAGVNTSETTLTDFSTSIRTGSLINFSLSGSTSNWIAPGGVVSGNTTLSVCPTASALNFDGVNDKIEISNSINTILDPLNTITVEAWVKPTNIAFNGVIAGNYAAPNNEMQFLLRRDGSTYTFWVDAGSGYQVVSSAPSSVVLNSWQHVAGVWNGSALYLYIDGVLVSTVAGVTGSSFVSTANNVVIGSNSYPEPFAGSIDEVRIWSTARSQCDIVSYKNCEISASISGLISNYHFNQGFPSDLNPAVTTLTDASGNAFSGTLNNFALNGTTSNWVAPGGVVSGFTTPTVCTIAAALNFDGSNDYVEIGNVIPAGSSYTKEMWVYALDNNCNNLLSSGDDPFYLSSGRLAAGNNGNYNYVQDVSNFPLNTWVHTAVTYDALTSTMKLYVNGNMVASGNSAGPYSGIPTTYIGRHTGACYFSGKLDEVRVWNVARTQCEINTYMNSEIPNSMTGLLANYHFNQGLSAYSNPTETTLTDASGNGSNGILSGFGLNGSASNWVAPGGVVSDYTTTLAPPVVTVNSGAICAGQSFTMSPSGAVTYTYSNGTDVAMPTADATYTVTGTNAVGCEAMAISSVTVNALPTVSVTSGAICAGQSFTMIPSGASTYTYSNGTDVVTPTTDATYSVSGTDANGCVSSTDAISSVTVNALPTVSVTSGAICAGQSFTMIPSGASTYTYSNGTAVVTPTADATYSVSGTDANGCVSSTDAISSVTVNALPTVSVTSGAICAGQSFTMIPSGASTYTYSNGTDVVTPTADATYSVSGTDANGCVSSIAAVSNVTVNALPTISVNSGSICAGQSFTMVPSGASTYTYSNGTDVVTPTADATYSVSGTDANGCVSSTDAVSNVTVNALPIIMATTTNTLLCVGETATLSVTGATSYTWSTAENTADIAVSPTVNAIYTVDGTDANGCVNTTTVSQDVSSCTGIMATEAFESTLRVFPNPNNGLFTIELNTTSQVIVINALGQVVISETLETGKHSLDIHYQATGVYFVKVIQHDKQQIIKLIKE